MVSNDVIARRRETIDMIKELSNRFENIRDSVCAPYGLSSAQAIIILDIYHNPKNSKVTDICARLNKSTNTISPLINRLVEKGFLTKVKSSTDARVTNVELTEKTKKITENINIDVFDYTWPMFEALNQEELTKIYDALKLLMKVVE